MRALLLGVLTGLAAAAAARGDGLIQALPDDGAWALYVYRASGEMSYRFSDDAKPPEAVMNQIPRTATVVGLLTIRSVGKAEADGKPCRWIELEQSVRVAGRAAGGGEADPAQRTIILKLLIPEARLKAGQDPFKHVVRMGMKDGSRKAEVITDAKRQKYELDRFRPLFPEPAKAAKRAEKQVVDTAPALLGKLTCTRVTFPSTYDGPLSGGKGGRWVYKGEHRLWLSDKVPFGVARLELDSTSTETYGDKGDHSTTTKGSRSLVICDLGTKARSRLPEVK